MREVKNLNSFRNVEKAINYEFAYQANVLSDGGKIRQETLLWDDNKMTTRSIRTKEDAHDYRYFPEPDLPPLKISNELIEKIRSEIPDLPHQTRGRLQTSYSLEPEQIDFLIRNQAILNYFESMSEDNPKRATKYYNWVSIEVVKYLKDNDVAIDSFPINPDRLKELVDMEIDSKADHVKAKNIFSEMIKTQKSAYELFVEMGYDKEDDLDDMESFIVSIFKKFPEEYERLKSGEDKLVNFFMGMIMKESRGKYLPVNITNYLKKNINNN